MKFYIDVLPGDPPRFFVNLKERGAREKSLGNVPNVSGAIALIAKGMNRGRRPQRIVITTENY